MMAKRYGVRYSLDLWCCGPTSNILLIFLMSGTLVNNALMTDGIRNGSYPSLHPASDLQCVCNNYVNVICTWNRGEQDSLARNSETIDTLQYVPRIRDPGEEWHSCSYYPAECNTTTNKCHTVCKQTKEPDYMYRVQTTTANVDGPSLVVCTSGDVRFNRRTQTILNPPYDVTIVNVSATQLTLSWHIPRALDYEEDKLKYIVQWRIANNNWSKESIAPNRSSDITRHSLGHLEPNRLYSIRVRAAMDVKVKGNFSEIITCRTSEEVPGEFIEYLQCFDDLTDATDETKTVTLSWKLLEDRSITNGKAREILITSDQWRKYTVSPNETTHVIRGLSKDQIYTFNVTARNSAGESAPQQCSVHPESKAIVDFLVVAVCVTFSAVLVRTCAPLARKRVETFLKYPEINLRKFETDFLNAADCKQAREVERFDELTVHELFVDIGPKNNGESIGALQPTAAGFDIGDKQASDDLALNDKPLDTDVLLSSRTAGFLSADDSFVNPAFSPDGVDIEIHYMSITQEGILSPLHSENPAVGYGSIEGAARVDSPVAVDDPAAADDAHVSNNGARELSSCTNQQTELSTRLGDADCAIFRPSSCDDISDAHSVFGIKLDADNPIIVNGNNLDVSPSSVEEQIAANTSQTTATGHEHPSVQIVVGGRSDSSSAESIEPYVLCTGQVLPGPVRGNSDVSDVSQESEIQQHGCSLHKPGSTQSPYIYDDQQLHYVSVGVGNIDEIDVVRTEPLHDNTGGYIMQDDAPSSVAVAKDRAALSIDADSASQDPSEDVVPTTNDATEENEDATISSYVTMDQAILLNENVSNH